MQSVPPKVPLGPEDSNVMVPVTAHGVYAENMSRRLVRSGLKSALGSWPTGGRAKSGQWVLVQMLVRKHL